MMKHPLLSLKTAAGVDPEHLPATLGDFAHEQADALILAYGVQGIPANATLEMKQAALKEPLGTRV